jgi:flagellar protein FlaG
MSSTTISKESFNLNGLEAVASKNIASEKKAIAVTETTQIQQQQALANAKKSLEKDQDDSQVREQLTDWVQRMNKLSNENVKFNYNEDAKGIFVTVVNRETNEVIRQIPNEDALKLSAIWKEAVGNIFDARG